MAKTSGLAVTTLGVGDSGNTVRDIRNDVNNFQFSTPRGVQDVTGVDKSAIERLLLLADFSLTLNGTYNPTASTSSHAVFSTVPSTSVNRTFNLTFNSTPAASLNIASGVIFTDYALTRSAAGELTWTAPGVGSAGIVPTWS